MSIERMDESIYELLERKALEFEIPIEILYPIVMLESRGNPLNHNLTDKEDSRGLLQVNIKAHPNANKTKLFDPEYNLNYQLPELKQYYEKGKAQGLDGIGLVHYVEKYGQRPQWTTKVQNDLSAFYFDFLNNWNGVSANTSNETPPKYDFDFSKFEGEDQLALESETLADFLGFKAGEIGDKFDGLGKKIMLSLLMIVIFVLVFFMVFIKKGE